MVALHETDVSEYIIRLFAKTLGVNKNDIDTEGSLFLDYNMSQNTINNLVETIHDHFHLNSSRLSGNHLSDCQFETISDLIEIVQEYVC